MSTTRTTTATARAAIADLFAQHGATLSRGRWQVPVNGGYLAFEVTVRGSLTTRIAVDRWHCHDAPRDIARPWLEANVWPASTRWCVRTGQANFMPCGGDFSSTSVLTGDALDVLTAWLPQEIAWQVDLDPARPRTTNPKEL
jgi:hypothetical protein